MKKIFCLAFSIILLANCSCAITEDKLSIRFHGVDWFSSEEIAIEELNDLLYSDKSVNYLDGENGLYIQYDEILGARPYTTREYPNVTHAISITESIKEKIAGYVVNSILLSFAYDGIDSKLICVKIDLLGSRYNDLKNKLNKVYGEGKNGIDEDNIQTTIWKENDNSCVLLYSIDGESADLIYGTLAGEQLLKQCAIDIYQNIDPNDVSGL